VAGEAAQPETKYARVGPDRLAYQVLGQGPPDLVFTMGAFSHVDIVWEDPQMALFLRRLASFSRLLRFDRRGTGASDPLPPDPLPPSEVYAEELVAVMDATGSRRVALLATGMNHVPLAISAQALSRPGALGAELVGADLPRELRQAGVRQLWIVVPFAVVVAAIAHAWSGRRPSMGDRQAEAAAY
jgi:pimeloyl-ACP methyl ester carboxylesterase